VVAGKFSLLTRLCDLSSSAETFCAVIESGDYSGNGSLRILGKSSAAVYAFGNLLGLAEFRELLCREAVFNVEEKVY
jgi:hypothetical protein